MANSAPAVTGAPRHSLVVRVTHWVSALCFAALLVSGLELVVSHPRFYWGEDGNALMPSLFDIPIPASRPYVKTGYNFVLPDQNGWSRSLHFQTAWIVVFTGLLYAAFSVLSGHLRRNLLPPRGGAEAEGYNRLQRATYLFVVYGLFPLLIWTGLAMSPAITAVFPFLVEVMGGHQSARTIHFFATLALVVFAVRHVVMVYRTGFRELVGAMITGRAGAGKDRS